MFVISFVSLSAHYCYENKTPSPFFGPKLISCYLCHKKIKDTLHESKTVPSPWLAVNFGINSLSGKAGKVCKEMVC